jgi:trehalose/maltose hydrolase-like predicted phosphorylase
VIEHRTFPVEPWCLTETSLELDMLAQTESLFALSNGHIGLRGNLDEGEPYGIPGTYLNGYFELRPLPYAEAGYGYPEEGQTLVDVTNGKLVRLLVDDAPFDVRYGTLHRHRRRLDLRSGLLEREVDWTSNGGRRIRVRSRRLVSFTQRAVAAIEYEVEAVDPVRLIVQSELVANESQPRLSNDPRVAAALDRPLRAVARDDDDHSVVLLHRTARSGLLMGAGMSHVIEVPGRFEREVAARDDWARMTVATTLEPGQRARVVKLLAYGWSALRSDNAVRDQVAAGLAGARFAGWDGLVAEQRAYLDDFWDNSDVEVEGNAELQQAVRFALFHVLQCGARAEHRALPSKGLTGPGYDGHTFWDAEGFVLPVLTYTVPKAAADVLRWRHSTLDLARERAATLGLSGATFPWRTIRGQECSSYWPAGTAAFHVNADIAAAVVRYVTATGDRAFEAEIGLELLVENARLWMSLGHHDRDGRWHVDGVTGPDEYSAVADDNVFTNLMAARTLVAAADACRRHPDVARELKAGAEEQSRWRDAAAAVHLPYDGALGVHEQSRDFTMHAEWDFEAYEGRYPLLLHAPYVELYRKQVVKQADLVLAMYWCGDRFTPEDKARNVDYYERRTVRDSSLSAAPQAVMAAEVGHLQLAYDYTYEAALIDLLDLQDNSADGLHMASLAGAWTALVGGFGGFRDFGDQPAFDPALPDGLTRLCFSLQWHGMRLMVDVTHETVTYSLRDDGSSVTVLHAGTPVVVRSDGPVTMALVPRVPLLPPPTQPAGRTPRSAGSERGPAGLRDDPVETPGARRELARENAPTGPPRGRTIGDE